MKRTYIDRIFEYYQQKDDESGRWGAEFLFPMPPAAAPLRSGVAAQVQTSLKRLLVVDDEALIRNTYFRIFTRRGFQVLTAANAMEAKDLMVREKVDIMFLDIKMAEVEGDTLFEVVRAFHQDVKIVVASVYPLEEQKERIKNADAYFDKSDSQEVLVRMVTSLLRGEAGLRRP